MSLDVTADTDSLGSNGENDAVPLVYGNDVDSVDVATRYRVSLVRFCVIIPYSLNSCSGLLECMHA